MSILIFILVLFVLILVHEWGHFIVAKKTGMRVDEFGIGFPPKVTSVKKGETEYSFNIFPIGGFVRIFGEDLADTDDPEYNRSFASKSKLQQAAVLLAGVVMNVIFAWFLFFVVLTIGVPTAVDESEAGDSAQLLVASVLEDGPADKAGLERNAIITSLSAGIDKDVILNPTSFRAFTEDHPNTDLEVGYELAGEQYTAIIKPEVGIVASDPERPAVGVALSLVETKRTPFYIAWFDAAVMTISSLGAITVGIATLLSDTVLGQADFSQVAGPIGIAGLVGDAAEFGFTSLLLFTAFISLNLAVINLLPIPALDGGRLLFVGIEAVTKKPINPVWTYRLNAAGFFLLIALMILVTWSDVTKLI